MGVAATLLGETRYRVPDVILAPFLSLRNRLLAEFVENGDRDSDPGKLATMLEAQPDSCAYCCQCGFASVAEEQELRAFAAAADAGSLGWVCGGHTASASASAAAGAETAAEALA